MCSGIADFGNPGDFPIGGFQSQRQSPHGPGESPSGNFQSHQPHHFLNPALRVNNGMTLDMDMASQGFANRVRRVPNSTFPPSSTGNLEEDGLNNPGGKYSVPGGGCGPSIACLLVMVLVILE